MKHFVVNNIYVKDKTVTLSISHEEAQKGVVNEVLPPRYHGHLLHNSNNTCFQGENARIEIPTVTFILNQICMYPNILITHCSKT